MSKQIKLSLSEKAYKIIDRKAKKLGMNKASYCFNIIFENIRKEVEEDV